MVGATFSAAAIAVLVLVVGPGNISHAAGNIGGFVLRQTARVGALGSVAIAGAIRTEGRRLWVETATPLPTATATATPEPTWTPLPTPLPPRRIPPTPVPQAPAKSGQALPPQQKPGAPPALPFDDAAASMREYFEVINSGNVRRALQYWAPEAAPEARSALDAIVARGDKYTVRQVQLQPSAQIRGAEITVDLEITEPSGQTLVTQQRYMWRYVDNQWYITTRLQ